MKQVSNKGKTLVNKPKKKRTVSKVKKTTRRTVRVHPKFGTSKLEEDFAKDFLDKLKVRYVYQFEAKDIGRFYDFYFLIRQCIAATLKPNYKKLRFHYIKAFINAYVDAYKNRLGKNNNYMPGKEY